MKATKIKVSAILFENGDILIGINEQSRYGKEYHVLIDAELVNCPEIAIYNEEEMREIYGVAPKSMVLM